MVQQFVRQVSNLSVPRLQELASISLPVRFNFSKDERIWNTNLR